MTDRIKALCKKYEEILIYLIVGVMTTIVSWGAAYLGKLLLDTDISWQNIVNNSVSWLVGVLFAYPLNRRWVFKSTNPKIVKEFLGFAASRISTLIMDVVIMWLTVNVIKMNYWIAKIFISSVIVTITNYIFSKLLIFKKKA
ncbi:MAG: GtrA family protein [Butyrivibrio sp.]|nr:GtrA family protein [Acetatifactor muris]MCM1558746.1 GtrA family protein [Butyrivibrio sp.]